MQYIKKAVGALVATMLLSAGVFAESSGSKGVFTIHNNTKKNVVVGFYTNDGSGWSDNWLGERLNPSEKADAKFSAETGSCDQKLQVGWLGQDDSEVLDEAISIDICKATNVYLNDNEIYYD